MKEYILEITQMMKRLTDIMDKCSTEGTKAEFREAIYKLKDLRELLDY